MEEIDVSQLLYDIRAQDMRDLAAFVVNLDRNRWVCIMVVWTYKPDLRVLMSFRLSRPMAVLLFPERANMPYAGPNEIRLIKE